MRSTSKATSQPGALQSGGRSESGFSVLELIIALLISVEILIAMAIAFDVHNKVSRVQLQITDMQQSLRIAQWDIARTLRMAGRGGLKADLAPGAVFNAGTDPLPIKGRAIEVRNNVTGAELNIARGDATSPTALEGTDILIVRGCFGNQLFQVNSGTFDGDSNDDGLPGDGSGDATLILPAESVASVPQGYDGLKNELDGHPGIGGIFGRMLIASYVTRDDWGIAKVKSWVENPDSDPKVANLTLTVALGTQPDSKQSPLNPIIDPVTKTRSFPTEITASSACLLEEYRYYIRDVREPGDNITPLRPRLTRARFEPGTETPYQGDTGNLTLDLADQVFDLQIALGFDADYASGIAGTGGAGSFDADDDNLGVDDVIYEADADSPSPGRTEDDWLYNDPGDDAGCDTTTLGCDATTIPYLFHQNPTLLTDPVDLYFVRITTAARTFRPDNSYQAPDFDTRTSGDWLEDHDYDTPPDPSIDFNSSNNRKHRRRTLTTIVEMRNI